MAEQCARKSNENSEQDLAATGDDIEPIEIPSEDVEMGSGEDEEPLEAEVQGKHESPRIPRVERNKNMTILDKLSAEVGVLLVSNVVELVDNIELNCWKKR